MFPFCLRAPRAHELPEVVALIRALADFEKLPGPDEAAAARFAADYGATPPRFELLVAEQGGRLVAYALFFPTYSTFRAQPSLFLEDLFVLPEARGQGLGTALLGELARLAEERGCGRFEWLVLDWNVGAIEVYRRLGAAVLPEWRLCRIEGAGLSGLAKRRGE